MSHHLVLAPSVNLAVVVGVLSSDPRLRTLPSGSELIAYEVTSTDDAGTRRTVPVVWLDPKQPPAVNEGDEVVVVGSIRRRFFRAGEATASRTEVEARVVARAETARAGRALEGARAVLGDSGPLE